MALTEKEILMYLEEIPDHNDLTDIESDNEDEQTNSQLRNNFDLIFQQQIESMYIICICTFHVRK